MDRYEESRLKNTERINYNIVLGQYNYLSKKIGEDAKKYKYDITVYNDDFYAFRTAAILMVLYDNPKYDTHEAQEIVIKNSEHLRDSIYKLMSDYLEISSKLPSFFNSKFNVAFFDSIRSNPEEINALDKSIDVMIDSTKILSKGPKVAIELEINRHIESLLRDLNLDINSEIAQSIISKIEALKEEFLSDFKMSNIKMFENFSNMLNTLKSYIFEYVESCLALSKKVNNKNKDELGVQKRDLSIIDIISSRTDVFNNPPSKKLL